MTPSDGNGLSLTETELIRRGLHEAGQKRSRMPQDMGKLKAKVDLRKLGQPLPDGDYCSKCGYPKRTDIGCECAVIERERQELEREAVKAIGGAQAWYDFTEEGFIETEYNRAALAAARGFHPGQHNMYLHSGMTGTGKSRLAAIAKRRWINKRVGCITLSMDELYLELREHNKSARDQRTVFDRLIKSPLLGIEDLGVEKDSEFAINALFRVIDSRKNDRRNGLIITSNFDPDFLGAKHGNKRVASRLFELCRGNIFNLAGEKDWRREPAS
jgi:DNA replication protein DnaC